MQRFTAKCYSHCSEADMISCDLHSEANSVFPTDLTVQLIGTDKKPCSRGLRLSVGSSISSQQIQSPQGVNVEVLLQLQSSFQDTDGVSRLLLQLRT